MSAAARPFCTVVTGVPRSGTSLAMQMLGAGGMPLLCDGARPADADNPRGYFEFEPVRRLRHDASWVPRAEGRAVKVVHALVPALPAGPRYRAVLLRRRLDEVVASQRAMLARRAQAEPADARALDDAGWIDLYARGLSDLAAWIWRRPDFALLELDYNALVRAPEAAARALDGFLGDLDVAAMIACVDPALYRHRRERR